SVRLPVLLSSGQTKGLRALGVEGDAREHCARGSGDRMSSLLRVLVVVAIGLGGCSSGQDQPAVTPATPAVAWQTLFDGSSLDGWGRVGDANWQIIDGAMQADMGTGFLLTNGVYDDFDLELEF